MFQVAMVDKGDHWDVIADYSGSARHSRMSEGEWKAEFATAPYNETRASQPGILAGLAPQSVGQWKKDWSGRFMATSLRLRLSSDAALDFDGVPVVNAGVTDKQNILIQAVDGNGQPVASSAALRIMITGPVAVSSMMPTLSNGQASIVIGPSGMPYDIDVTAADPSGTLQKGELRIRFK